MLRWKWVLLVLGALVGIALCVPSYIGFVYRREIRLAREAGMIVDESEFERRFAVPDRENAALVYERASAEFERIRHGRDVPRRFSGD